MNDLNFSGSFLTIGKVNYPEILVNRKLVFVRAGKGNKDRHTIISDKALELLKIYLESEKPEEYLFEGQHGGMYSDTSIRKILQDILQIIYLTRG